MKFEEIVEIIGSVDETLLNDQLSPNSYFSDIGVDSLVMMDICLQIEELTGVTVPDDALYHIETIQDMLSFVNRVNVD